MFDCFTDTPDWTPFQSVSNNVPLDQMNPDPQSIQDPVLREDAWVSQRLNFREVDRAPEDVLEPDPVASHEGNRRSLSRRVSIGFAVSRIFHRDFPPAIWTILIRRSIKGGV